MSAATLVPARRLAGNLLSLGAGEAAAKLLSILAFTYLGRTLGPQSYGRMEFAMAALVFFHLPADLGLSLYGAREIARNRHDVSHLMASISAIRLGLAVLSYAALLLFALTLREDPQAQTLLCALGLSLFAAPGLLQWVFQGLDQMSWAAWAVTVRQGTFAVVALLLVRSPGHLIGAAVAECAAAGVTALFCIWLAQHSLRLRLRFRDLHVADLLHHLRTAAPIGLSEFAWALLWHLPTVILGFLTTGDSLGWFGASHRSLTAIHSFVYLYFFNLIPSMSRAAAPGGGLPQLLGRSLSVAAWCGLLAGLGGTLLAGPFLSILYGARFAEGGRLLSILVWVIPVALVSGHFRYGLVACGLEKQLFRATVIAAAGSIVFSLVLGSWFGAEGVAFALVLANAIHLLVPYWRFRPRLVDVPVWRTLFWPVLAAGLAFGLYWASVDILGLWPAIGLALCVFASAGCIAQYRNLAGLWHGVREAAAR
ncbi:MAG: oligosaccharide flippase family protein [Paludibaculum sp.]